jgi:hypothetical protein
VVSQTVYCTRAKPSCEIVFAKVEGLAEVEQDLRASVFQKDLVAADFVDSTIEDELSHFSPAYEKWRSTIIISCC